MAFSTNRPSYPATGELEAEILGQKAFWTSIASKVCELVAASRPSKPLALLHALEMLQTRGLRWFS